jgi:hypothetical protein
MIVTKTEATLFKTLGIAIDGRCPLSDDDAVVNMDELLPPGPSPVQLEANIVPTPYPACVPTIGECIETYDDFIDALESDIGDNSIIGLCSQSTIIVEDEIEIFSNDVTLCCESTAPLDCTMEVPSSANNISNVVFFGTSVTIRGIAFKNGNKINVLGGNVAIDTNSTTDSNSNHIVDQCSFDNGISENAGGNLFIGGGSSATVSNCLFSNGDGNQAGGNLIILSISTVLIENNKFTNGNGDAGGNIYVENTETSLTINNNIIENGNAETGGGIHIVLPDGELSMNDNTFVSNNAQDIGGAVLIELYDPETLTLDISTTTNDGTLNDATICPDIYAQPDPSDEFVCIELSDSPTSPVATPTTNGTVAPMSMPIAATLAPIDSIVTAIPSPPVPAPIDFTTSPTDISVDTPSQVPVDDTTNNPTQLEPIAAPTIITNGPVAVPIPLPTTDEPVAAPIAIPTTSEPTAVPGTVPTVTTAAPVVAPSTTLGPAGGTDLEITLENFFISFDTGTATGEPTEDEIDIVTGRIQQYLFQQFETYFAKALIPVDLNSIIVQQTGYEFNPDNKPGSIYLSFSNGSFLYQNTNATIPGALTHAFLLNSLLNNNNVFINFIKTVGGTFSETSETFFGTSL